MHRLAAMSADAATGLGGPDLHPIAPSWRIDLAIVPGAMCHVQSLGLKAHRLCSFRKVFNSRPPACRPARALNSPDRKPLK
jgi:hypothetical protein